MTKQLLLLLLHVKTILDYCVSIVLLSNTSLLMYSFKQDLVAKYSQEARAQW